MCAIFGTIGSSNLKLIQEISQKQIYRGPDEQNFYISDDKTVCLGNNRLSVIDKKNGKQPMLSSDKRYVTVFNGCIYNFLEIQNYLKKKGINFFSSSDTEVVANSFMYFGEKVFNYFDGMWAIAIYDKEKREVILSRDYVGQKPLYYSKNENYYIFASQLNGLFEDQKTSKTVSRENLIKYFTYSFVPAPNTIFKNIYQVEPGENIKLNLKNLNISKKKYWDLQTGPDYNMFVNNIEENNFKDEFQNIINQHSVADKSPMISLSGGIDSYIIMNNFVNNRKYSTSYTLGFENKSYDESKYVKKIDKNITKKIFNTNDVLLKSNFIKISKLLNEPVGDSSIVPTFIIQEKIGIDSNVSLGGDGGDESFFGYITFDAFYLATKLKKFIPNFIFSIIKLFTNLFRGSSDYISQTTKIRRFFNSIDLNEKYLLPSWLGCLDIKNLKKLFNENLQADQIYNEMNDIYNKTGNKMRYAQIYHYKYYLPMILSKIDQASMFNSVESRSPFLSKKIINFGLSQDVNKLYKLFKKKLFIREAFRSEIPNEILNRKKHGFAFPKEIILKDKKFINNLINHKLLINKNFFDIKYDNYLNKNEDCGQYIWNELILNLTLQNLKINKLF